MGIMAKKVPNLTTAILDAQTENTFIVKDCAYPLKSYEAAFNSKMLEKFELEKGDWVRIIGKKRKESVYVVVEAEDAPDKILFLSKEGRSNVRVRIGDTLKIYQIDDLEKTKSMEFFPIADTVEGIVGDLYEGFLKNYFAEQFIPLSKGNIISITNGKTVEFRVGKMIGSKGNEIIHGVTSDDTIIYSDQVVEREEIEKDFNMIGYDDVGGCRRQMAQIRELVQLPLRHPTLYKRLGVRPPKGILLYGPPGTGKTLIAKAIANETGAFLYAINGPQIMSKMSGESEGNLRSAFEEAEKHSPAIIFMDEIDSIAPKRDKTHGEAEKRVVSQLLTLMDGLKPRSNLIVLATTNRPNSIDPALRRYGRFDREIEIGIPDAIGRLEILRIHSKNMKLSEDVDLEVIANETHGFVGSDIASLCSEAALQQIREKLPLIDLDRQEIDVNILSSLAVTKSNFDYAVQKSEPSSLREAVIQHQMSIGLILED